MTPPIREGRERIIRREFFSEDDDGIFCFFRVRGPDGERNSKRPLSNAEFAKIGRRKHTCGTQKNKARFSHLSTEKENHTVDSVNKDSAYSANPCDHNNLLLLLTDG